MRRWGCLLLLLPLLALAGCGSLPSGREMGDMALLRTLGVDGAGEGLEVTASTGPRPRGLQGEGQAALTLSARAPSLSGALLALQGVSESYVFFGYVDQLLLGEELARQGTEPVLEFFARDVELSLGTQLWLVRGDTAGAGVRSGGEQGIEARLSTFLADGELGLSAIPRTAGEVLSDMLELGSAFVPALVLEGQGEDAALRQRGYGVLKDGRLVGFLEGEAAVGLELLAGRVSAHVLEVETGEGRVSVLVSGGGARCWLTRAGGGLALSCKVTARLAGYEGTLSPQAREEAAEAVGARESARVRAALEQLAAWEADCTGLASRAALASPGYSALPLAELELEWELQVEMRG